MLKPWYKVITPREDLREGRPLDASEFAVHLDQVRDRQAPEVYTEPKDFFERTYLTRNLSGFAVEALRRLQDRRVETSAVFNLSTQFGGGKTHALTLLYHLARGGAAASSWKGVASLLEQAGLEQAPEAATAVFVGTEFDSITGRGGENGEPLRKTPWGEIAWQLASGDLERYRLIEEHERTATAPGGEVLRKLLPANRPILVLFDEVMNYVNRHRKSGLADQLYSFLHNLSETARGLDRMVLAISLPASELEMSAADQEDYSRLRKLLDRVGKSVVMSAEAETAEIIRRRLFEWQGLPEEAAKTAQAYADWVLAHRTQLPSWFPIDTARQAFAASYPFHPSVLSVFERKWQALPSFQQTRGVLRLLALWVAQAYRAGFAGAHQDPLLTLGTAPLEESLFRAATFDQLGESKLEGAVTTDIAGKEHAHALRLDAEATAEVRKARLHRKVASTIFFESNGGQQKGEATAPEIRLAVAEPDLDIGSVEQCLETLVDACYYLTAHKNRFRFSFVENLNKVLADRRASVPAGAAHERVREEVRKVFALGRKVERVYFPAKSGDVPDVARLTLAVLDPEVTARDPATPALLQTLTREHGASARTFKSAVFWCVAESGSALLEEARRVLAWEEIGAESDGHRRDEETRQQIAENVRRAQRDLREAVWRSYKLVYLLEQGNTLRALDLGLIHSSASPDGTLVGLIVSRLQQDDLVSDSVSPSFLVRNWPPALPEWSTRGVRDAFFASPKFPRLLDPEAVRLTLARGVEAGLFAYAGKGAGGEYRPFHYKVALSPAEIELADDLYVLRAEDATAYLERQRSLATPATDSTITPPGEPASGSAASPTAAAPAPTRPTATEPSRGPAARALRWQGEIEPGQWMVLYSKLLAAHTAPGTVKVRIDLEIRPPDGLSQAQVEELRMAVEELGVGGRLEVE